MADEYMARGMMDIIAAEAYTAGNCSGLGRTIVSANAVSRRVPTEASKLNACTDFQDPTSLSTVEAIETTPELVQ